MHRMEERVVEDMMDNHISVKDFDNIFLRSLQLEQLSSFECMESISHILNKRVGLSFVL